MSSRLEQIWMYPIKGFAGVSQPAATVVSGGGIPFDRQFAVSNGLYEVAADGGWTHCRSFVRQTKNPEIAKCVVAWKEPGHVTLEHPEYGSVAINLDDATSIGAANTAIAHWFPHGPRHAPRLERCASDIGYWDHDDATIAIINLATVRQLSALSGRHVDPNRFRGNLLVDADAPWAELGWLGRSIRVGTVTLDVVRPIDRCTAPNIDPASGAINLNIPQLLHRYAGHIFCGVYARVREGGALTVGDSLEVAESAPDVVAPASRRPTAPATTQWPRPSLVTAVVDESVGVRSFWLRDLLATSGIAPALKPGQHLRMHAVGPRREVWRSYTISGWSPEGDLRVTVKRVDNGRCSTWLHYEISTGDQIIISGPHGDFIAPAFSDRPVLFLSAGIGITPLLAMARSLANETAQRPVRFVHVDRSTATLALWPEVQAIARRSAAMEAVLHLDGEVAATDVRPEAQVAPINLAREARYAATRGAIVYLCGPCGFMTASRSELLAAGVAAADIHEEVFVSPSSTPVASLPPPSNGPFSVVFLRSGAVATWTSASGTLLDLADAAGLALPSHCRAGVCGSCQQRVDFGTTANVMTTFAQPAEGTTLLCCSVPTSDVTIDS
jgi:uncharacterized protein